MPRKRKNEDVTRLFGLDVCAFCGRNEDNEILYGKLIVSDSIYLHTNCMFFASGLSQKGEVDKDVLSGFLFPDIELELRRGKKLFCAYCRKRGATVGCCQVKCKKSFHLPCGVEHGSLHQFFGSFSSFCKEHSPIQKAVEVPKSLICHICCEDISVNNMDSCLYSPCCNNSWFHKICLQKYALSAGCYFFKCPLCNNSQKFMKEMKIYGICIPDKDASWELEENAYQELLLKPECDAPTCLCPKGRKYCPQKKSGWTLLPCSYCGSHARHMNCENIKHSENSWICNECKALEAEILKQKVTTEAVTSMAHEPTVKDSSEKDSKIITPTVSCVPSSSQLNCTPSPVIKCFKKEKKDTVVQNVVSEIDTLHSMISKNSDISCNVDVYNTSYSESKLKNFEKPTVAKTTNLSGCVSENDLKNVSCIKKFETSLQEKQVVNFKDIKNVAYNSTTVPKIGYNKAQAVRKVIKKRKLDTSSSTNNHYCISKYFGQECCKFRL